jgi:hypothetical protein
MYWKNIKQIYHRLNELRTDTMDKDRHFILQLKTYKAVSSNVL